MTSGRGGNTGGSGGTGGDTGGPAEIRAALVVIREPAAVRAEPMEAARAALAVAPFSKKEQRKRVSEYRKRGKIHEENEESIGSIGHGVCC